MRGILGLLLLCAMVALIPAGGSSRDSRSILLRVSDWETYLRPIAGPNNVGNCLIVYTDGRLRLQLRRQEFFRGKANYSTYEGALSKQDLASLYAILDDGNVRKLPELRLPKLPLASAHFEWFTAEIYREGSVQKVGYSAWEGEPRPSEDDRSAWQDQRVALQPLVQWSRGVKSFDDAAWRQTQNANSVCQP